MTEKKPKKVAKKAKKIREPDGPEAMVSMTMFHGDPIEIPAAEAQRLFDAANAMRKEAKVAVPRGSRA